MINGNYYALDQYYKEKFGEKVKKISLECGFTCPNRDGTLSFGGCSFCSEKGSGDFAKGLSALNETVPFKKIAYLQSFCNTYDSVKNLSALYDSILKCDVVGLEIATRADCITPEIATLLHDISKNHYLVVELGMQTIHNATLDKINRHLSHKDFLKGYELLKSKDINICLHIINGLPDESEEMMIETAKEVNRLNPHSLKIHMLNVIKNTPLGVAFEENPFKMLSLDEYVNIVCNQLELLNTQIKIARLTGDAPSELLICPKWCLNKIEVLNAITQEFKWRKTKQGSKSL